MCHFCQKGAEPNPIYISTMTEGGLAKTTKAIQLKDELVEVNGVSVKVRYIESRRMQLSISVKALETNDCRMFITGPLI